MPLNSFEGWLKQCQQVTNDFLAHWLAAQNAPECLRDAMQYCLLLGGKRLRPALVYAVAQLNDKAIDAVLPFGAVVECVHAYSLCHDDLPAMDDDDLRRGQPACHIAYGEATAILVGDALQAAAFEILANADAGLSAEVRLRMVQYLSQAIGAKGMVGGQTIDIAATVQNLDDLAQLHDMKTGALLCVSAQLGALAAGLNETQLEILTRYSQLLGRAFQVTDDCLDVMQPSATLGKPQHSDSSTGKITYTELLGLEGAQLEAKRLKTAAMKLLDVFDERADRLRALTDFVIDRQF